VRACLQAPSRLCFCVIVWPPLSAGPEAVFFPIVGPHQDNVRRLNEERSEVSAPSLGDAAQDRFAARAVLAGNETEPCAEIPPAIEGFTCSNRATRIGMLLERLSIISSNGMDGSPFHPQAESLQLEGELS
jgi:hypothetical protein